VRYPHRQRRGFSLPELLVAAGIVAVLLSMLLPALGKAREQAQRTHCLANLRTLTTAWLAYAHANGGRLCRASAGRPDRPGFYDWVASCAPDDALRSGVLWPYVQDTRPYLCPNDRVNLTHTYAINSWLDGEGPPAPGEALPAQKLSRLRDATATFVYLERFDPGGPNDKSFVVPPYPAQDWTDLPALGLHARTGTVSFADGHAAVWSWRVADEWHTVNPAVGGAVDVDLRQAQRWIGHEPYPPAGN
jgi:prepilin-type N-terminal cleavage/methylation domain-containing protein/prepilin-type processing-associated H-X9-DG protein